jgi:eukaryotic-like serine/threonine-protein kinase
MTPERWQEVKKVLCAALDLEPEKRPAYLDRACATDDSLRQEVQGLLDSAEDIRSSFLEFPLGLGLPQDQRSADETADTARTADSDDFRITPSKTPLKGDFSRDRHVPRAGHVFGPYLILRLLGKGGFGQVWEAESLDARRRVALKILTEVGTEDPDAVRRFEREGQVAASLSHPNCVYTFGAQQIEGYPTIAMELMPGGTLQDRLDKQGRLSVKEAVDFTLQVVDGLEAAHEAGIVHRDVKPSNCFLDAEGHAKVGDFGISRSLQSEVDLTMAGSFLGTPSYASPEQVRGRELDFRSDIYSVGALLYALLTGKPPFVGSQAGEVLAKIVAEEPTPFSDHRVEVPTALQRIVLRRALAKDREKRYQDYASFRQALLPFSSRGLTAATLARRFGAICLDLSIFMPISFWSGAWILRHQLNRGSLALTLSLLVLPALRFLYFVSTEAMWGQSLGKRLFGLRVTTSAGSTLTLGQVCLRTAVFVGLLAAPAYLLNVCLPTAEAAALAIYLLAETLLPCCALVATMRRTNEYAGLHEILSHTRVRSTRIEGVGVTIELRANYPRHPDLTPETQPRRLFGPYKVVERVWETEAEALFIAYDEVLRRRIWVHAFRDVSQAPSITWLADTRPGRLHWLQGSRTTDDAWDAYEAPPGTSFSARVRATRRGFPSIRLPLECPGCGLINPDTAQRCDCGYDFQAGTGLEGPKKGQLSWHEISVTLSGVLAEIAARLKESLAPRNLSLDHIWVQAHGQARVLDFPSVAPQAGAENFLDLADWRALIHQMVLFALEGNLVSLGDLGSRLPRVPFPEYARPLITSICQGGPASESPETLLAALESVSQRPARVTTARRLGTVLVPMTPSVCLLLSVLEGGWVQATRPGWTRDYLQGREYVELVPDLIKTEDQAESRRKIEAIRKVLASTYREVKASYQGNQMLATDKKYKELLESMAKDYPALTPAELMEARRLLDSDPNIKQRAGMAIPQRSVAIREGVVKGLRSLAYLSISGVILAFILRGGLLLALFGIAVQRSDGDRAGRLRCLLRAVVAWSPLAVPLVVGLGKYGGMSLSSSAIGLNAGDRLLELLLPLMALGAVYAVLRPERGIQDRIAGTCLVPR